MQWFVSHIAFRETAKDWFCRYEDREVVGTIHPHESLWSDASSKKRTQFRHVLISNASKTFLLDIFCGSSSTLFSAVALSCAACYMYFFFLENTLYMYIEFDNTNYTRCLAVSILTAFKIQMSVSLKGMHNRRKYWSAFSQMKTETE